MLNRLFLPARRLADLLDRASDSVTTFRGLLYTLLLYLSAATVLGFYGKVAFSAGDIILSALWLIVICKLFNWLFSKFFNVPINHESDIITALILALILSPASDSRGLLILTAAALVAMLSKYIISYNGRHIFNPAALGAFAAGALFHNYASWWVANTYMAAVLLVAGFLVVRKMRRFTMVIVFTAAYLACRFIIQPLFFGGNPPLSWHGLYLDFALTPLLFFAPIMLTEPLTSPAKRKNQIIYALSVAIFYSMTQLHVAPETALLIGNMVAFAIEPNRSLLLRLVGSRREAADIYTYFFKTPKKLPYLPGQYMEWTLPGVAVDARGNRRYLTLSSSPTEAELAFTVKKPPAGESRFKKRLGNLKPGQQIIATRLAGDFTLPEEETRKLAFIAGGVGITPFRSIIKSLVDTKATRDIALFYSVNRTEDIAFSELFTQAKPLGVRTSYVVSEGLGGGYLKGHIDKKMLRAYLPDYSRRLFYISGPQAFVAAVRLSLLELGVQPKNITTDFFPGYN